MKTFRFSVLFGFRSLGFGVGDFIGFFEVVGCGQLKL